MVEHIFILKKKLADKELYLWDVGKRALITFYQLATRGIKINGFVTNYQQYYGETILNLPVLPIESLRGKENVLIITNDNITEGTFDLVSGFAAASRFNDCLEVNPKLRGASVFLYGTDTKANYFSRNASWVGFKIRGFLVFAQPKPESIFGLPAWHPDDFPREEVDGIILHDTFENKVGDIIGMLEKTGYKGNIFVKELIRIEDLFFIDPFIMLDDAMKKHKRILFCCEGEEGRRIFRRVFDLYQIPVAREVCYEGSAEEGLDDIWSLADENPRDSVLLIHAFSTDRRVEIINAANDLGYSLSDHNYAATDLYTHNKLKFSGQLPYEHDLRVEYSIDYSAFGGLPGWAKYGDESLPGSRIMILGGSTSSEVYYPESWVSKLYRKILADGKTAVIYNGAHEGHRTWHEINRMMRDIHALKPDIVISMSGLNDMRPMAGKFEKIRNEPVFDHWRRMESYMKLIAEAEGASFYCFLQPINQHPKVEPLYETMMYCAEVHKRAVQFTNARRDDDFYYNLMPKFVHRNEMLIDSCHYSEKGNEELAETVYQIIKEKLL